MVVYLVRHGKDDETVRDGWSNHGLLPAGIEQVNKLAAEVIAANITVGHIYSSDLQRAKETSQILSAHLKCPVEYNAGLRETNNGALAGMKHALASEKYPSLYWSSLAYDECYPDGESPEMFCNRITAVWSELKSKLLRHQSENSLIVTHGGVIEVILCIENNIAYSNKNRHFPVPNAKLIPVDVR